MQSSGMASLLNCMKYNYDNGQKDFWGYEIGRSYLKVGETDAGIEIIPEGNRLK